LKFDDMQTLVRSF